MLEEKNRNLEVSIYLNAPAVIPYVRALYFVAFHAFTCFIDLYWSRLYIIDAPSL